MPMKRFTLFLSVILTVMLFSFNKGAAQEPSFDVPDFAFPETVIKNASAVLDSKKSSSKARMRALLELTHARCLVEPDSVKEMPALIARYAEENDFSEAERSLLLLMEAHYTKLTFSANRWTYMGNEQVSPLPADPAQWSANDFARRIDALCDSAARLADADNRKLDSYKGIVTASPEAYAYIPALEDFAAYQRMTMLNEFADVEPWTRKAVEDIIAARTAASAPQSAPLFYWTCLGISKENKHRAADYLALYEQNADIEAARYVLQQFIEADNTDYDASLSDDGIERNARRQKVTALLENSLAKFPDWYNNDILRRRLALLKNPTVCYETNNMCAPGDTISVDIAYSLTKRITVTLYRYPEASKHMTAKEITRKFAVVSKSTVECDQQAGRVTAKLKVAEPGRYALICNFDNRTTEDNNQYTQIICTPFIPVELTGCSDNAVVTLGFHNGAPVSGVNVSLKSTASGPVSSLGTTNAEGVLMFKPLSEYTFNESLGFKYQGVRYSFNESLTSSWFRPFRLTKAQDYVSIFTDRQLYRPGDTVEWAIATGRQMPDTEKVTVNPDARVKISLYDANYEVIDSVRVTSDAMGRACGSFKIPGDRLSGSWRIKAEYNNNTWWNIITVSDFKLPVFTAEFTEIGRNAPSAGQVTLNGTVKTYSGMPVAGAKVSIEVKGLSWWRFYVPQRTLGTLECVTDAAGNFTVVADSALLAAANDNDTAYTRFSAEATVTSTAGETSQTSCFFNTGKPYDIVLMPETKNLDSSKPFAFTAKALDSSGKDKTIALEWMLVADDGSQKGKEVLQGKATSGQRIEVDVNSLAAGSYTLVAAPVDSALADKTSEKNALTLYNEKRNELPPTATALYLPVLSYETDARGRADILVGTTAAKTHVYTALRRGDKLSELKQHTLSRGFNRLTIDFGTDPDVQLIVFAVADGLVHNADVRIKVPATRTPEFIAESFRDRLVPGSEETWRFRLVDGKDGVLANAAVIATMYNKALDQLATGSFGQQWQPATEKYSLDLRSVRTYKSMTYLARPVKRRYAGDNLEWPEFVYSESPRYNLYFDGVRFMKSAAGAPRAANGMVTEMVDEGFAMDASGSVESEMGAEDTAVETPEDFEYRPSEVLQAFWKPQLLTDENGNVDIAFTVPQANTTWQFKAFAWNTDGISARYDASVLADKPVMVQPNLPRFLRQGDKTRIAATVFNNSDKAAQVVTTIEIFDVTTGAILKTATAADSIAEGGSALAFIETEAPFDAAAIGYRVRSSAGGYIDGEQALIPVLEATTTVVESDEFYLAPDASAPFEITIDAPADACVTLQYCQNPIWTVVKAMRGLSSKSGSTAPVLASQLFSALAARHITATTPGVAQAIAQWRDNPDEEALTSMLDKNADLKTLLLDRTPWVQAAADNNTRMATLASLLSPDAVETSIANTTAALKKLQNKDGGFGWGSWSKESSMWMTSTVVTTLALAHSLGMLPQDNAELGQMTAAAVNYLQNELARDGNIKTDFDITLISALMPVRLTPTTDAIVRRTVGEISKNWKKHTITAKAYDVLILKANGREQAAAEVLESIRQFGVIRPDMGMCFPSVDDIRSYATIMQAFAVMKAPASELDAMRQWVIIQAQASDDFGVYNPDYVIASLLMSGSNMTSVSADNAVTVNGKRITLDKVESASGYFSQKIDTSGRKTTVSVQPNGVTPSYGSVVTVMRRRQSEIKARPGRDVSIEKRLMVRRNGTWTPTDRFEQGEQVRVELVVKARRDIDYVAITDHRAACLEPTEQLPEYVWNGGTAYYRENRDSETCLFINRLSAGTYVLSYEATASAAGSYISGMAMIQSQYAPELTARSGAQTITIE